jgi:hypothetical protein
VEEGSGHRVLQKVKSPPQGVGYQNNRDDRYQNLQNQAIHYV